MKNYIKYLFILIFAIVTLVILLHRVPFHDEAHSWMIAKSFNLFEIFQIEKYEGHLFIWYVLQMPFAKNDFFYPYPIYFLNWGFCIGAIILLWRYAPFSDLVKFLITFSYPFVWYFAVVARCYSLGLIIFFTILILWKKRLEHLVLIPSLIILLANTSAIALIAASALGCMFLFDLFRSKLSKTIPLLIFDIGAVIVLLQLFNAGVPEFNEAFNTPFLQKVIAFFYSFDFSNGAIDVFDKLVSIVVFVLYAVSIPYFYQKSKRALFFFVAVNILMTCLFIFKYSGSWWHFLFFYVFFIAAFWIANDENREDKKVNPLIKKIFNVLFFTLIILFNVQTVIFKFIAPCNVYNSKIDRIVKVINDNDLFKGYEKIYTIDHFSAVSVGILPYFPEHKFIDLFGNERYSFSGFKNCNNTKFDEENVDAIANTVDDTKENIMISVIPYLKILKGNKNDILLTLSYMDYELKFFVYKIKVKRKSY